MRYSLLHLMAKLLTRIEGRLLIRLVHSGQENIIYGFGATNCA